MDNKTASNPTTGTPAPSNTKILVFVVLLALATIFWLWSVSYRDNNPRMENDIVETSVEVDM